jgi:beta-lactamase superfamily II metal-dependent hydrolase
VRQRLAALDVDTLRFMQLTHAHADHFAGMDEILAAGAHVRSFVYNGQVRPAVTYQAVLDAAEVHADTVVVLSSLRALELGAGPVATDVTMVPPLPTYIGTDQTDGSHFNEGSLGTEVRHGAFRMFLTGDGEVEANQRWRMSFSSLTQDIDVLKVGHHGANNAIFDDGFGPGNSAWLDHTQPAVAVISANGTSHPRVRALSKLMGEVTDVYCTNVHGEIRITVDELGFYTVTVEKNAGSDCVPGDDATT